MTTIKNKVVRFLILPSLFVMVVIFQGCGGGSGGGGSGSPDTKGGADTIVDGANGADDLVGIGASSGYDCAHKALGPTYNLDADTDVHFERSYVHANDCAQISEKVVLNSAAAVDLHIQVAIYNPLVSDAAVQMQTVTIPSGQTASNEITLSMSSFAGAKLLTMQIVSTDSTAVKVGKVRNLNIYRFTSSTEPIEFTQISSGLKHTCALLADGKAVCWGDNTEGQLGAGHFLRSETPLEVISLSDVKQIVSGESHTCAIAGGERHVFCWGKNSIGQLGLLAGASQPTPTQVNNIAGALQIEVSRFTTCVLKSDQTISCWGSNIDGLFADGTTTSTHLPTASANLSNIKQISLGANHACAVTQSGSVLCWGKNTNGQLGDNSIVNSLTPVAASGLNNAIQVSAGGVHTCATSSNGTLRCWGANSSGQLGVGHKNDLRTPTLVNLNSVEQIVTGTQHTCALQSTGSVHCWGANGSGQIGNGIVSSLLINDVTLPAEVKGLSSIERISTFSTGLHTCGLFSNKGVLCWGDNTSSQLANGSIAKASSLFNISSFQNATKVVSGRSHACAIHTDSTVSCLGRNDGQQLGQSSLTQTNLPIPIANISNVTQLALGNSHTCALLTDKTVKCWGSNFSGQLGNGTNANSLVPVAVSGLTNVRQVTAGAAHTCAVLEDNTGYCWGNNFSGQLGIGTTNSANTPQQISGISNLKELATSMAIDDTCALLTDKTVKCWGFNAHGHLGTGNSQNVKSPFTIAGFVNIDQIQIGFISLCGRQATGSVICQGFGGQLGNGSTSASGIITTPVSVTGITTATKLSNGSNCAILANQTVKCWGRNANLLVNGSSVEATTPVLVTALAGAADIENSGDSMYARFNDGTVSAWGVNDFGQIRQLMLNSIARYPVLAE